MVPLSPVRPSGPADSGLETDVLMTPFTPDAEAKDDLDPPLKLRIRGAEEKEHKGRWHRVCVSPALRYVEPRPGGRRSRHLLSRSFERRCAGSLVLLRRCRSRVHGPDFGAPLLAWERPAGPFPGCSRQRRGRLCAPPRRRGRKAERRWNLARMRGNDSQDHFRNDSANLSAAQPGSPADAYLHVPGGVQVRAGSMFIPVRLKFRVRSIGHRYSEGFWGMNRDFIRSTWCTW